LLDNHHFNAFFGCIDVATTVAFLASFHDSHGITGLYDNLAGFPRGIAADFKHGSEIGQGIGRSHTLRGVYDVYGQTRAKGWNSEGRKRRDLPLKRIAT
jgi:hypothetical protein